MEKIWRIVCFDKNISTSSEDNINPISFLVSAPTKELAIVKAEKSLEKHKNHKNLIGRNLIIKFVFEQKEEKYND